MAESTQQFVVSNKEDTEKWLTDNGMAFNVSLPRKCNVIYRL
jgi:hypothetical protein